jgi:hypothetical protein
LGTRHLLEDENYATAKARERQFYTITVVPDARLIQYAMNEQVLHLNGYHLEFEPERLEVFQENEGVQAESFGKLFDIFSKAMSTDAAFQLASEKLDYQFTEEQMLLIKSGMADKQEEADKLAEQMAQQPQNDKQPFPPKQPKPPIPKALIELDKWEDKVTKAGKMVVWHNVDITTEMMKAIKSGTLSFAQAREQLNPVSMLFAPQIKSDAAMVLEGLRESINFLVERK